MPPHLQIDHLRRCFTAYSGIFICRNLLNVISPILPPCAQLYTGPCKCPTKNQCAAIVHCSTESHMENSFCLSTLIILHCYCSLPYCGKSGCIIRSCRATRERKRKSMMPNDEGIIQKQVSFFFLFLLLTILLNWQRHSLNCILIYSPLINDLILSRLSSSVLTTLSQYK